MENELKDFTSMNLDDFKEMFSNNTFGFNVSTKIHSVKIKNTSPNKTPVYVKEGDSGFDLRAWISDEENTYKGTTNAIGLQPLERRLIHTGLYMELPYGTELQVRTRSGCALKQGLVVLNSPGTVDELYRGEVCVIIINLSNEVVMIENGDRIAQGVLMSVLSERYTDIVEVGEIDTNTDRGVNGFNSTGLK